MKIALLTNAYPPAISGSSLTVQRLAQGFAARGHSVMVIAASDLGPAYRQRGAGVEVVRFASIPTPRRIGFRFVPGSRSQMICCLREFDPDVLHFHDPFIGGLLLIPPPDLARAAVLLTANQLPWFVSVHAPNFAPLRRGIEDLIWGLSHVLHRHTRALIVPSRAVAAIVARHGFGPSHVISNGVDTGRFHPTPTSQDERDRLFQTYGLRPDLPVILHVGRLDIEKKVDIVVRAVARVLEMLPAQLLVVGRGTQRPVLEKLVRELDIEDRVRFAGLVPPEGDLPALYRLASVFAIACEIETEGMVVLEAAASAVPVVAVRASSMPELLGYAGNGFLVPPGNFEAMAQKISYLLSKPDVARKIGRRGLRLASSRTLEHTIEAHLCLYRKVVTMRTPVSAPRESLAMLRGATEIAPPHD